LLGEFGRDLRFAARMLYKNRVVTLLAVATLSLGIGASTAVFSVVDAVLLCPLHFPHSEQICFVWRTNPTRGVEQMTVSPAQFLDWRERNHSFAQISAWRASFYTLTGEARPEQVWGVRVSANFFDLLEIKPEQGRTFVSSEE
jgi:hypothetical protein